MRKTTVIFILPDLESGGAERIVMTIANHLPRDYFEPKIMLLRKEGSYLQFLKEDVEVIDLKTERIRYAIMPIIKEIRKRKPDIVFSGFGEVNAYLSLFIRFLGKSHFIARETNVVSKHVTRKEIRFFYRFYNNYDRIVCQSQDMMLDLIHNFKVKQNKIKKINNPVDFDFINQKLGESERPHHFSKTFKHVVAIGNLSERKGFDNLLTVFNYLKEDNIMLHIIGDGRDRDRLEAMRQSLDLDHVIFHGRQENPYRFLKFANLFVLSSRYEGFPNVLLEAGACGVYALANNCLGGINEIIIPELNGEIAEIENFEIFAQRITELVEVQQNVVQIKESIRSRFSKEIILEHYEQLFHQISKSR